MTTPPPPIEPKTGFAKFLAGFGYAVHGLAYAFRTQCNIRVHTGIAAVAILAALLLRMPALDFVIIVLTITIVMAAELFNTAIETMVDLVSPEYHVMAKITKDVSAAAVLICAVGAVLIGLLLFGPLVLRLLSGIE